MTPRFHDWFRPTAFARYELFLMRLLFALVVWDVLPPVVTLSEQPVPAGGLPKPGKIDVQLRNNHLQYVLTWFGLALALAGVYVVWLAGRLRRRA